MTPAAGLLGYLLGTVPTAVWLARLGRVDLLTGGSQNPGANNALRLGGPLLAIVVLGVEAAKGALAAGVGASLDGSRGMAAAGVAAVVGNVVNPWLRWRGGQGLGIAAGVLAAAWPSGLVVAGLVLAVGVPLLDSTRPATLLALIGLVFAATIDSVATRWGWGIGTHHLWLAGGVAITIGSKQLAIWARDRSR